MNDNLKALFEGVELSEETKTKITAILESEVEDRVSAKEQELTESFEKQKQEYQEYIVEEYKALTEAYIQEEVIPTVNKYVDYAVQEFVKENNEKLNDVAKVTIAESFLKGLSGLAEGFNVKLPEGVDSTKVLEEKVSKMTERFDEQLTINKKLQAEVKAFKKEKVVEPMVKELAESQKEKFMKVLDKVEFIDESQFTEAAKELYESYFPKAAKIDEAIKETEKKTVINEDSPTNKWLSGVMSKV